MRYVVIDKEDNRKVVSRKYKNFMSAFFVYAKLNIENEPKKYRYEIVEI